MQPEEPFADASAPASMDAGPPSAAVRRRAVSEATTDQEERLGSRRPSRDEANRDGGTMRRVDSLEKLAPELKANQESFVSSGSDGPKEGSILPHGLEDDDASRTCSAVDTLYFLRARFAARFATFFPSCSTQMSEFFTLSTSSSQASGPNSLV